MTSAAAVPVIGVISGAISMAPITTASESSDSPRTAMTTDSVSITEKRNHQCPVLPASGYRSAMMRCRSCGPSTARGRRPSQDRDGVAPGAWFIVIILRPGEGISSGGAARVVPSARCRPPGGCGHRTGLTRNEAARRP